jgi:hypothetical protein
MSISNARSTLRYLQVQGDILQTSLGVVRHITNAVRREPADTGRLERATTDIDAAVFAIRMGLERMDGLLQTVACPDDPHTFVK